MAPSSVAANESHELGAVAPDSHARLDTLLGCKRRMLASGWCHHRVEYLAKRHNLNTFSYLSTLEYMRDANHDVCKTQPSCVAYTVNNSTYQTRHVTSGCTCHFVETPHEDLKNITATGGVPLVQIELDNDSGYKLRIHRRERHHSYVAISHVWADGLGNPSSCALPSCQIARLHTAAKLLFSSLQSKWQNNKQSIPLVWMDTLCIPPHDPALRAAQIDKMASIYKGAFSCLVMDAELMTLSQSSMRTIETYARLICSAWNSRSWTLQERALPPHTAVLFAGNALTGLLRDGSIRRLETGQTAPQTSTLIQPLSDSEIDVEKSLRKTFCISASQDFAGIWNELAGRATSQPADIPLIIANLMDLEVGELMKYERPEQKYQALLLSKIKPQSREGIPLSLFWDIGPKFRTEGSARNAWIPTAIGSELLRSRPRLICWFFTDRCLHLDVKEYRKGGNHSIYTFQAESCSPAPKYIQFPHDSAKYTFEPPTLYLDEADVQHKREICMILDQEESNGVRESGVRRGACFLVVSRLTKRVRNPLSDHKYTIYVSFRGPLRVQRDLGLHDSSIDETMRVSRCNSIRSFRVLYDLFPDTEHLNAREGATYAVIKSFKPYMIPMWMCVLAMFGWFTYKLIEVPGQGPLIIAFKVCTIFTVWVGGGLLTFCGIAGLVFLIARLSGRYAWQRTQEYEMVHREREPTGEV